MLPGVYAEVLLNCLHCWTSLCVCPDWQVWRSKSHWSWCHHPTLCCWSHRPALGWVDAEKLRSWFWNIPLHCHQHMQDYCLKAFSQAKVNSGHRAMWAICWHSSFNPRKVGGWDSTALLETPWLFNIMHQEVGQRVYVNSPMSIPVSLANHFRPIECLVKFGGAGEHAAIWIFRKLEKSSY